MNKKDLLTIILIFLNPLLFISSKCLALLYLKFVTSEQTFEQLSDDIYKFRKRQIVSAIWTAALVLISLFITHFYLRSNLSNLPWINVASTMLLTHAVFAQLGWPLRFGGMGGDISHPNCLILNN